MSNADFLLDTNVFIGLLKNSQSFHDLMAASSCAPHQAAISQVTRIELLSYPHLSQGEETAIKEKLATMPVIGIDDAVEQCAIKTRKLSRLKFADSVIAATALAKGLQLLTLDKALLKAFNAVSKAIS
jgi:predicted nucleic acid-binding protein